MSTRRLRYAFWCPALALVCHSFIPSAAAVTAGPSSRVNAGARLADLLSGARVATDADGDSVVVWVNYEDASSEQAGIRGRLYDRLGLPKGGEFTISPDPLSGDAPSRYPDVAMDDDGNFVVTWPGPSVMARCYRADGTAVGGEFQVNTTPAPFSFAGPGTPRAAMSGLGDFVIAWPASGDNYSTSRNEYTIRARRFGPDCLPLGPDFQAKAPTAGPPSPYDIANLKGVAMDDTAAFVIQYEAALETPDGSIVERHVFQRLDAAGNRLGAETPYNVNSDAGGGGLDLGAGIATDRSGNFVVAWHGRVSGQPPLTGVLGYQVFARRFDRSGRPVDATEFIVSTGLTASAPSVAMDDDGDFSVAWIAPPPLFDDGTVGFFAPIVTSVEPVGGQVLVQRYAATPTRAPTRRGLPVVADLRGDVAHIALSGAGDFSVVWADGEPIGRFPPYPADVYVRRYMQDAHNNSFSVTRSGAGYDPTPVPGGPAGTYSFNARFCNKGLHILSGLTTRTAGLSEGKSLVSRDRDGSVAASPGGAGSSQDVGRTGAYSEGLLASGECVTERYVIGLDARTRFSFSVDILGDQGDVLPNAPQLLPPGPPKVLVDSVLP